MPGEPFGPPGIVYISGGAIPLAWICHAQHQGPVKIYAQNYLQAPAE